MSCLAAGVDLRFPAKKRKGTYSTSRYTRPRISAYPVNRVQRLVVTHRYEKTEASSPDCACMVSYGEILLLKGNVLLEEG